MPRRLVAVGLVLLTGCQVGGPEACPGPADPQGTLLRLDPGTGARRAETRLPYADVQAARGTVSLTVDATPSAVARSDRVVPSPRTTSTGTELVGPRGWRLHGAAGTEVGVVKDRVVVLGDDAQLRGLRLGDGRPEWNTYLDHHLAVGDAELVGGVVYVAGTTSPQYGDQATSSFTIAALDARTGRRLWRWTRLVMAGAVGVAVFDDVIVAAAEEGQRPGLVVAVDRRTGKVQWQTTTPRPGVRALVRSGPDVVVVAMDYVPGCV